MNRDLKSIAYAFISKDLEVYLPDDDIVNHIVVNKLICNTCGQYWHTNLLECYFCSSINCYLYRCIDCGNLSSITGSKKKCSKCGSKNIKACMNPQCISNTIEQLLDITADKGGIFNLDSSFNLSLTHCVSCGSKCNTYKSHKIYVYKSMKQDPSREELLEFSKKMDIDADEDIILIKKVISKEDIIYSHIKYTNLKNDNIELKWFNSISEVVDNLYPVDK